MMTKERELTLYRSLSSFALIIVGGATGWFATQLKANTDTINKLREDVAVLLDRKEDEKEAQKAITAKQDELDKRVAKLERTR